MSDHLKTKAKVKSIASVSTFEELLDACTLTEEDKEILRMIYLDGHEYCYIGDRLGYSESTIKRRHRKALQKLNKMI